MKCSKRLAMTVLAVGIAVWGSAQGVQYYNLTQLDKDANGGTYTPTAATTTKYSTAEINGAVFTTIIPHKIVGTGVLDPFVRIQATKTNNGDSYTNKGANCNNQDGCVEFGYNTDGDGSKAQYQTKDREGSNWNKTIELATMGRVDCNDGSGLGDCVAFILDINERVANGAGHDEFLSLDQFRLFASDDRNLKGYTVGGSTYTSAPGGEEGYDPYQHKLGGVSAVFDMDFNGDTCPATGPVGNPALIGSGGDQPSPYVSTAPTPSGGSVCDRSVGLNYALNSGSGNGVDLLVKVPETVFGNKKFVYLFSSFGELGINSASNNPAPNLPTGDFAQSAGFEEWATIKSARTPIAPTFALLLVGLVAMGGASRIHPRKLIG